MKSLGIAGTGITTLNGLSTATQSFVLGTAGTDIGISSAGSAHTFDIPTASATKRGALSSADWTTFNSKMSNSLTSANIWVGNSGNVATAVSMSGDATMSNAGVVTLATSGVTAGSYAKVSVDAKGRVIAGLSMTSSDITTALGFTPAGAATAIVQNGNSFGATAVLGTNDANSLAFETNNSTKMTILSGGNVGIGTTSPDEQLTLADSGKIRLNKNSDYTNLSSGDWGLHIETSQIAGGKLRIGESWGEMGISMWDSPTPYEILIGGGAGKGVGISGNNTDPMANNGLYVASSNNVGIGTTTPGQKLTVAGTIESTSGGIKLPDATTLKSTGELLIVDEKPANTAGGTFTSGSWQTRTLNTTRFNTIPGASLASNQITLPAGTYYVRAVAPTGEPSVWEHKAILYNVTGSANLVIGTTGQDAPGTSSFVEGQFTLASTSTVQIRHRCMNTVTTNGFGWPANMGVVEVYTTVYIKKIE